VSRDIFHRKSGVAMRLGKKGGSVAALLRNQITFMAESPGRRAFLSTIQTDLPGMPLVHNAC
jgi:hypothetical protein